MQVLRTQKAVRSGFCPQGVVGADRATLRLSAKTVFQAMHFQCLYRPFREQVRSHAFGQNQRQIFIQN
ncbi:hypothetical protein CU665_27260 [Pseudomonas syringae pv. actinidifoliorum]|nr:hypothetical protein [Pseudomonas syringae pv. actinidifoliorum]